MKANNHLNYYFFEIYSIIGYGTNETKLNICFPIFNMYNLKIKATKNTYNTLIK